MAGYSGTPLAKKLGYKTEMIVAVIGAPATFLADDWPEGASRRNRLSKNLHVAHLFTKNAAELRERFPKMMASLAPGGFIWISWPKKASGVTTDLNENVVREVGLTNGMVDTKVCAIDEVWSGLKFMFRKKPRA